MKKINVAIDGFSSCGKSTMAKELAQYAGYIYVDTGAMYRAVAYYALTHNLMNENSINEKELKKHLHEIVISFKTNESGKQETYLNAENIEKQIRTLEVGNAASKISTIGFVRQELVKQQKKMGVLKGVVMDGRDIGTVVFPDAELKIYLTATPRVRAERRYKELLGKGKKNVLFDEVLKDVEERDYRDTNRQESPLKQASDAVLLDNSNLSIEEQRQIVRKMFDEKIMTKQS